MKKICAVSGVEFEVTEDDLKFYEKMGVPSPTSCPEERRKNRFSWRNERVLYKRNCDCCNESMISVYNESVDFPVYCPKCWWGDATDSISTGKDFDFSRPFFEQFAELQKVVPRLAIINSKSENCDYTHFSDKNKNCYLVVGAGFCEDCLYGYRMLRNKDCVDAHLLTNSELCYECIDGDALYDSSFCMNCTNSRNIHFCYDCRNCENCFGCSNLRDKSFYFANQACKNSEEYFNKVNKTKKDYSITWNIFRPLTQAAIHRSLNLIQTENCSGNNLKKSKKCHQCFDLAGCEEASFCMAGFNSSYCSDMNFFDHSDWCYNSVSFESSNSCICSFLVWYSNNVSYSIDCFSSHDLLGCIGVRQKKYCILNKEYSKEEYFVLRDKIIEHMKETGEWGEFFPAELSPFKYEETIAEEYFPIKSKNKYVSHKETLNSTQNFLACECCRKVYKIQKAELKFYRKMSLPIPHKCPDCRHAERIKLRNPRKLWKRNCDKCGTDIQTTFAPDRPEKVYCEKCYLDSVE